MLEYVLLTVVGCLLGVVTGLTPGLHVNTVCLMGLGLYEMLGLDPVEFGVAMVAMSVTHTFLDFIPAIFLGVPEESTALSVLPTHRLLLEGRALEAVKLTAYGSILGLAFALLLLAPAAVAIPVVYREMRGIVVYVVGAAATLLVLRENGWMRRLWAAVIFLTAGTLGAVVLNIDGISSTHVLFPVFSGLFGLSGILYSMKTDPVKVPQQEYARVAFDRKLAGPGLAGAVGGMLVGVLPAMSPSQVGILMSGLYGSGVRNFLIAVSAINTSDAVYSLAALYTIRNPRSGVATMLGRLFELNQPTMLLFVGVFALTAALAYALHIAAGKMAVKWFGRVNYRLLSSIVFVFVLTLAYAFTGAAGVVICLTATSVGLLPILAGVSRTHLMGVLIIPTMMYFIGLG